MPHPGYTTGDVGVLRTEGVVRARSRGERLISRPLNSRAGLVLLAGSLYGVIAAYGLVHRGASIAVALMLLPALAWLLTRSYGGLLLGVGLIMVVPYSQTFGSPQLSLIRLASVFAATTLIVTRKIQPKLADAAVIVFAGAAALSWLLSYHQPGVGRLLSTELTPVAFYIGARAVPANRIPMVFKIVLYAGTVGALTVLYEYWRGTHLFTDPFSKAWTATASTIFRPGGIWGSPPGASTALCFVVLFGLACYRHSRGRERILVSCCLAISSIALVLTFTRAAYIGVAVGALVFLWLVRSSLIRPFFVAGALIVFAIAYVTLIPVLQRSTTFQNGVLRDTLTSREGYWRASLPIITSNTQHFLVGAGYGSLESPLSGSRAPVESDLATTPQLVDLSLHNQYAATMVEQGLIGLAVLILLLSAAFVPPARMARRRNSPMAAAVSASVAAIAVVFVADVALLSATAFSMLMLVVGLSARDLVRAESLVGSEVGRVDIDSRKVPPGSADSPETQAGL